MNKEASGVFDKLPDLENALSKDPKMSLSYISLVILLEKMMMTVAMMCY